MSLGEGYPHHEHPSDFPRSMVSAEPVSPRFAPAGGIISNEAMPPAGRDPDATPSPAEIRRLVELFLAEDGISPAEKAAALDWLTEHDAIRAASAPADPGRLDGREEMLGRARMLVELCRETMGWAVPGLPARVVTLVELAAAVARDLRRLLRD